jgi:hypothetical protein
MTPLKARRRDGGASLPLERRRAGRDDLKEVDNE